ncbi:hypothetical protein HRI_002962200 [Hibiscus trionum]|uniref:Reverse transcriptase n=1 Tax=Hibiscus trionum TaxID=183268 RepID=A0A9W7MA31_HIBTR|nr:hypothetical protein HRI_002962200 [Hibiscus trionum]
MKIVCWNVRGLGKLRAVRRLRSKLRVVHPQILFLMETKVSAVRMEKIRRKCGFIHGIDIDADGSRGGLSLCWTSDMVVNLCSYSSFHIDVNISDVDSNNIWRFTGFYGNPVTAQRDLSWNLLRSLNTSPNSPWLVAGDFNEILLASEKKGGRVRPSRQMNAFSSALNDCELSDLGYSGRCFPDYHVQHLSHTISDHCPISIDTSFVRGGVPKKHMFRFNANWVLESDIEDVIRKSWESADGDANFKLQNTANALLLWSRGLKSKRNYNKRILTDRLNTLSADDPDDENLVELLEVKLALNLESDKEEIFWEQRARVNWLQKGDRNTSFFHKWATYRKKKNTIHKLKKSDGSWVQDDVGMSRLATEYFEGLFTTQTVPDPTPIFSLVRPSISNSDNAILRRTLTKDEILLAVKHMAPLKASEGFSSIFHNAKEAKIITGTKAGRFGVPITHLLFADDSILFGQSSVTEASEIKNLISTYEDVSGQLSIWCSKGLVEQGMGWRIGDGVSVKIWEDAWVGDSDNGKIVGVVQNNNYSTVNELINTQTHSCGYKWLINSSLRPETHPTILVDDWYTKLCKTIWALTLPAKVRIFFWRFVHNLLPTATNLCRRQVNIVPRILDMNAEQNFLLWISNLFESLDSTRLRLFVISLWAIWGLRNRIIHEGITQNASDIIAFSKTYANELDGSKTIARATIPNKNENWDPPPQDIYKANFDASFDISTSTSISGIVISNSNGLTMAVGTYPNQFILNSEHAEAAACEDTLVLLRELGFSKVIVEGDSLSVISKLRLPARDHSLVGVRISNILQRARDFTYLSFMHVHRERNKPAHILARCGRAYPESRVWIEESPLEVSEAISNDRRWFTTSN